MPYKNLEKRRNASDERSRKWKKENPEKHRASSRRWREKYPEKEQERSKLKVKRDKQRYKEDSYFRLRISLSCRLRHALAGNYKSGSAVQDLGCSIEELKLWLESQFQEGMTWDNWAHDGWHIDHIIPLSSFDLTDKKQLKKACHWFNLQPLWAKDNLSKGAKLNVAEGQPF